MNGQIDHMFLYSNINVLILNINLNHEPSHSHRMTVRPSQFCQTCSTVSSTSTFPAYHLPTTLTMVSPSSGSSMPPLRNTKKKKKALCLVTGKGLRVFMTTVMFVVVICAFVLEITILQQHRQQHFANKRADADSSNDSNSLENLNPVQKATLLRKQRIMQEQQKQGKIEPVHYEGDEDTEDAKLQDHQIDSIHNHGHADDHEHADEDPHMHEGDLGEMVEDYELPPGFQNVLQRAKEMKQHCRELDLPIDHATDTLLETANVTTDLPPFGIIQALESYRPKTVEEATEWDCELPPETECDETQLTAVFLGYRPDRLASFKTQVHRMIFENKEVWNGIIKEVLLVWNGDRSLDETKPGRTILKWAQNETIALRIFYPLKEGFSNDLMNRYHPRLGITTKAILFYDDDGPFYRKEAVTSGFELWKRNANAQMGAMARRLDVGNRAQAEKDALPDDEHSWVPNCRAGGDTVRYNFQHFAQTGANMALPSGSLLHSNYLCFLWHPVLEEIRQFVRAHPVHPDDVTVSTIVSHVSGRSPKIYSRRVNKPDVPPGAEGETEDAGQVSHNANDLDEEERRLDEEVRIPEMHDLQEHDVIEGDANQHRRLLWDDGNHGVWARKRESSVNSLLGYFGSLNSGSNGWCFGTPYHDKVKNVCVPDQARYGMVPWMTDEMEPLPTCPDARTITEKQYMATA